MDSQSNHRMVWAIKYVQDWAIKGQDWAPGWVNEV